LYLVLYIYYKKQKKEEKEEEEEEAAQQHSNTVPRDTKAREREGARIPPEIPESRTSNPDHGIFDFCFFLEQMCHVTIFGKDHQKKKELQSKEDAVGGGGGGPSQTSQNPKKISGVKIALYDNPIAAPPFNRKTSLSKIT
jgi:hypothetical protein